MKRILFVFLFGFVLFFAVSAVSAQADEAVSPALSAASATASPIVLNETEETIEPIILPDSPLYFLKLFKEKVSLWLTFSPEKEVNKYLKLARLRMAEYQKMLEKGKPETAQKVLARYEETLNKVLEKIEELRREKQGILKISQDIEQILTKHTSVLQNVLEHVPPQAKESLLKAIEVSKQGLNKVLEYQTKEPIKEEVKETPAPPAAPPAAEAPQPKEEKKEEAGPQIHQVLIKNSVYAPPMIKVKSGDTIQWTNQDKVPHTATSVKGLFNSGTIAPGQKWVYKVNLKKGVYQYYCAIHPNKMRGTLEVE